MIQNYNAEKATYRNNYSDLAQTRAYQRLDRTGLSFDLAPPSDHTPPPGGSVQRCMDRRARWRRTPTVPAPPPPDGDGGAGDTGGGGSGGGAGGGGGGAGGGDGRGGGDEEHEDDEDGARTTRPSSRARMSTRTTTAAARMSTTRKAGARGRGWRSRALLPACMRRGGERETRRLPCALEAR